MSVEGGFGTEDIGILFKKHFVDPIRTDLLTQLNL
jgi:hypothetical protein